MYEYILIFMLSTGTRVHEFSEPFALLPFSLNYLFSSLVWKYTYTWTLILINRQQLITACSMTDLMDDESV